MKGSYFLILLLFCNLSGLFAQTIKVEKTNNEKDTLRTRKLNFSIGLGASSIGFPMYYSNLSFQHKKNVYAFRYVNAKERIESLVLFSHEKPFEQIEEYGLTYGVEESVFKQVFIQIEGGICFINGTLRGDYLSSKTFLYGIIKDYEMIKVSSFSGLLSGSIFYKINKSFSLGSVNSINFNKHKILSSSSIVLKYCIAIDKQSTKEVKNP